MSVGYGRYGDIFVELAPKIAETSCREDPLDVNQVSKSSGLPIVAGIIV